MSAFAVDLDAPRAILQFAEMTLGLVDRGAGFGDRLARFVLELLALRECLPCPDEL